MNKMKMMNIATKIEEMFERPGSGLFSKIVLGEYSHGRKIVFKTLQHLVEEDVDKISNTRLPLSEILLRDIRPYTIEITSGMFIDPLAGYECLMRILYKYKNIIRDLSYLPPVNMHITDPRFSYAPLIDFCPVFTYRQIKPEEKHGKRNAININVHSTHYDFVALRYNFDNIDKDE